MLLDYNKMLEEFSEQIEEEEEICLETLYELTNGKGDDEVE